MKKGKEKQAENKILKKEKSQILSRIDDRERLQEQKPENETIFGKFFGQKKEKIDFDKELEVLEKLKLPVKDEVKGMELEVPEFKLPAEKFEKITMPKGVVKDEEEIQKAISGMKKVKKKPFIPLSWFKKKGKPVEQKIETPEVMPRTYDKIDYIEEIEEKIHKARLALMDFKFDDAKRVYIEIMTMYKELEPKGKAKVYQDIKDLYYERKSAEKFAK